jgi:hypothetical protein
MIYLFVCCASNLSCVFKRVFIQGFCNSELCVKAISTTSEQRDRLPFVRNEVISATRTRSWFITSFRLSSTPFPPQPSMSWCYSALSVYPPNPVGKDTAPKYDLTLRVQICVGDKHRTLRFAFFTKRVTSYSTYVFVSALFFSKFSIISFMLFSFLSFLSPLPSLEQT